MKKIKNRGLALIMVLSISGLIMLLLGLITQQTIQQLQFSGKKDWQDKAYLAAYSGLQLASSTLEAQPYYGSVGYVPNDVTGQQPLEPGELQPTQFMFDPSYHFVARICNNSDGSTPLAAWDGMQVPPGKIYVRSDGGYSDKGSDGCVSLKAMLETSQPLFNHALFGDGSVSLTGSSVDSFTSSATGLTNFALATNQVEGTPISIDAASTAMGSILLGAEASLTPAQIDAAISEGASNTDKTRYGKLDAKKKVASYSVPTGYNANQVASSPTGPATIQPDGAGTLKSFHSLNLSSATTIKPGTYYIDDKVELNSGCSLTVDISGVPDAATTTPGYQDNRTVFLYVKNSFALKPGASIALPAGLSARNFQVMMIGDNNAQGEHVSQFSVEGQTDCTLTASGWGMQATVKDSNFKGAIQGATVNLDNSQLHYDESLRNVKLGKAQNNMVSGEVFNLEVTTNPALKTKIYTSQLGNTFTEVQPAKSGEVVPGQ